MPPASSHPEMPENLGDYERGNPLEETSTTLSFRARQISIGREVVVECLRPELAGDPAAVEGFLADVRAKGAVEHPGIASVFEAVREDGSIFYARDAIHGESLAALAERGGSLGTREVLKLLQQTGQILTYLENLGVATDPLTARHLVISDHGALRMVNQAIVGERTSEMAWRDRETVAEAFRAVLNTTRPGATRTGRLLDYVARRGDGAVTWEQIMAAGEKLAASLNTVSVTRLIEKPPAKRRSAAKVAITIASLAAVLALAAGLAFMSSRPGPDESPIPAPIEIPAGTYPGPGGTKVTTGRLWIGAGEVTIGEYAEFLRVLELIGGDNRDVFDHPEQPPEKPDHRPPDWEALLAAAVARGTWNGRPASRSHPVVNVDWWDAHAYANWRGARLPNLAEWFAAWQGESPTAGSWGPSCGSTSDVARGIHGLAGNVAEWIGDPEINPSFPMNAKAPVICGGSFQNPGKVRRWVESRNYRAPDLGFRIVFEEEPDAK